MNKDSRIAASRVGKEYVNFISEEAYAVDKFVFQRPDINFEMKYFRFPSGFDVDISTNTTFDREQSTVTAKLDVITFPLCKNRLWALPATERPFMLFPPIYRSAFLEQLRLESATNDTSRAS
jgi:hypothetical protein